MTAKKCAYSFWGYMADVKTDENGNEVSTPDGNSFYSWCIIDELMKRGYNVRRVMLDRDCYPMQFGNEMQEAFSLFAQDERYRAWLSSSPGQMKVVLRQQDFKSVKDMMMRFVDDAVRSSEFVLHEWRMLIKGRNDEETFKNDRKNWQPDLLFQQCVIESCKKYGVKLLIFDLDYKLEVSQYRAIAEMLEGNVGIIELGNKWGEKMNAINVEIPFSFEHIDKFPPLAEECRKIDVVYVGNRYERDNAINKYMPNKQGYIVKCYGNWLTSFDDSQEKWPWIYFGERLQMAQMPMVYQDALVTPLLAKEEYYENGFMTARIIEAVFYGTVPLFAEEYGEDLIKKYAGEKYAELLTIRSADDVIEKVDYFREYPEVHELVIRTLRINLKFMDVSNFVDSLLELAGE